ncbi:MAG: hypothetical protein WBD45_11015 [Terriglobales bacterium]
MKPKVLIVHENDSIRELMHDSLADDCDVISIATVSDAFTQVARERFDGIVVNLESSESLYMLIAGIHSFQPGAMLVAAGDPLNKRHLDLYRRLRGNAVVKPFDITQIIQFLPAPSREDGMES